jgi:hypothetical protein
MIAAAQYFLKYLFSLKSIFNYGYAELEPLDHISKRRTANKIRLTPPLYQSSGSGLNPDLEYPKYRKE